MRRNLTDAVNYWGFKCPTNSTFYVCENAWFEFFGCCASNPCADGSGICPRSDKRALSYDTRRRPLLPFQNCLHYLNERFYACTPANTSSFIGCCSGNPCENGCSSERALGLSELSQDGEYRSRLLDPLGSSFEAPSSSTITFEPISTLPPSPFPSSRYNRTSTRNADLLEPGPMIGLCVAVIVAVLLSVGLIAKYSKLSPAMTELNGPTYCPIISQDGVDSSDSLNNSGTQIANGCDGARLEFGWKPRNLALSKATTVIEWTWNVILTLIPTCFIALAIAVIDLDGRTKSSYGERIFELTRLGPSLYPILFTAVVGRFYKNFARWRLEQPGGIRLAILEQVFGSQSFATALERVFVVHTHVLISFLILFTWALSPLGGQSSSRILSFDSATSESGGTFNISYLHPAYQVSSYNTYESLLGTRGSVAALYSSSLSSSLEQKRWKRDMWDLPKIPQWDPDKKVGEQYLVDQDALNNDNNYYASLLGTKLRGLDRWNETIEYNFTVETSYVDLQCELAYDSYDIYRGLRNSTVMSYLSRLSATTDIVEILSPLPWTTWKALDNPPPLRLYYLGDWSWISDKGNYESTRSVINCTMHAIWLETEIHCGPSPSSTSCYARQQRRINDDTSINRLPRLMTKSLGALRHTVAAWSEASSDSMINKPSATENYFMGETNPYAGQAFRNWTAMDRKIFPKKISQRLTTAFNTFWDATLNPLGHTDMNFANLNNNSTVYKETFNSQPFMNTTNATMTVTYKVYRANVPWLAILLTTTLFLQILAILGLVLEYLIIGPDVLGYASSLTRDNPYVPFSSTGSGLGGPERARALRDLRLQLVDVRPEEDTGYLAVRAISFKTVDEDREQGSTETLNRDKVSDQALSKKLDPKRRYR